MMTTEDKPRIYVGTYAKYNDGNLFGEWVDLSQFSSPEEFHDYCLKLHSDESDPELMFQDYEGFPKRFWNESYTSDDLRDLWAWMELDADDRELLSVYWEHVNDTADIDEAREAFDGRFNREEDWADDYIESTGMLNDMPENLRIYFDSERFARDCELGGDISFVFHEGEYWAFRNV